MQKTFVKILILFVVVTAIFAPFGFKVSEIMANGVDGSITKSDGVEVQDSELKNYGIKCGMLPPTLSDCIAHFSFSLSSASSHVLKTTGFVFNFLTSFSLDKNNIDQEFVTETWKVLRDLANMLFILLMVVISISIILDTGLSFGNKNLVVGVVVAALVVNFSLFITKVVIDAGNIVTVGFYDAIVADPSSNDKKVYEEVGKNNKDKKDITDLSGSFLQIFNPTSIVQSGSLKSIAKDGLDKKGSIKEGNVNFDDREKYIFAIIMILITCMTLYTAYIFFLAGFLFASRIGMLWLLMIVSPLAFVAQAIPGKTTSGMFGKWWSKLISYSFGLVPFLFIMWLIIMMAKSGFFDEAFGKTDGVKDWFVLLMIAGLKFTLVITLLRMGLKQAQGAFNDGSMGDKAFSLVKKVGLGVATGGAAFAGRGAAFAGKQIFNRLGSRAVKTMESRGIGTGRIGRLALKGAKNIESAKFGSKESIKDRNKRIAEDRRKEMEALSDVKDSRGKVIIPKEVRQQEFRDTILKGKPSVIAFVTGQRAGEKEFVKNKDAIRKTTIALDKKQDELRKETIILKQIKQGTAATNTTVEDQIMRVDKLRDETSGLRSKLNKLKGKGDKKKKDDKKSNKKKK